MEKVIFEMMDFDELKSIRKEPKKPSGIYFLWSGDEIIYVGQSVNVYTRVDNHVNQNNLSNRLLTAEDITHVSIISCEETHLDVTEALYINKFKPRCNIKK
jgi:excinuclease UvrABC nuclease subunit